MLAQEQPRAFDVATVKPSKSTGGINNLRDPVQATWTNIPLAVAIRSAYVIQPDQLVGGPDWINSDRWDIIAKTDRPATRAEQNQMLQPLLADRFKLKVRRETRQLPQYELAIAKGGPKLHQVRDGDPNEPRPGTHIGRGLIDAHGITGAEFAGWLRGELGLPVIDRTGLTGRYDLKVEWAPDIDSPPDVGGPSIFSAIQELGLKLDAIKGPVEVLVIDHVEKPSEN